MYVVNGTVSSQYIRCTDQIVNYAYFQESTLFTYRGLVDFINGSFMDLNRMKNGLKCAQKESQALYINIKIRYVAKEENQCEIR